MALGGPLFSSQPVSVYFLSFQVRVLFRKELDKVYDPNEPEDDMREREEEMERMREHVFKESDTNKDHLISFEEFIAEFYLNAILCLNAIFH